MRIRREAGCARMSGRGSEYHRAQTVGGSLDDVSLGGCGIG